MEFKIGDKVICIKYDVSSCNSQKLIDWGHVFYIDDEVIGCAKKNTYPLYIDRTSSTEKVFKVTDDVKQVVKNLLLFEIVKLRSQIKKLTDDEKDELTKNEFEKIKANIISIANRMCSDCEDDSDFINRLKEICNLKKKLFSIKISDLDNVHKFNGTIKWKIRSLEELLKKVDALELK